MNETCVLLKAKDFFPPDLPIAVFRGKNTRAVYNAETRVLYRRDFWKIFYIFAGRGILVINGKRYPLGPGSICLIHPDDLTTFELESDITLSNILFRKKVIADRLSELKDDNDFFSIFEETPSCRAPALRDQLYLIDSNRKIQALVREMRREYLRNDQNSATMLKLYLMELLIRMTRLSARTFSGNAGVPWPHTFFPDWNRTTWSRLIIARRPPSSASPTSISAAPIAGKPGRASGRLSSASGLKMQNGFFLKRRNRSLKSACSAASTTSVISIEHSDRRPESLREYSERNSLFSPEESFGLY